MMTGRSKGADKEGYVAGLVAALSYVIVALKTDSAGVVAALSYVIVALKTFYGLVNLLMQYSLDGQPRLLPPEYATNQLIYLLSLFSSIGMLLYG